LVIKKNSQEANGYHIRSETDWKSALEKLIDFILFHVKFLIYKLFIQTEFSHLPSLLSVPALNASLIVKTSRTLSIRGRVEDSEACRTNVVFAEAVIFKVIFFVL